MEKIAVDDSSLSFSENPFLLKDKGFRDPFTFHNSRHHEATASQQSLNQNPFILADRAHSRKSTMTLPPKESMTPPRLRSASVAQPQETLLTVSSVTEKVEEKKEECIRCSDCQKRLIVPQQRSIAEMRQENILTLKRAMSAQIHHLKQI
jgi:formate hydrogenlyase subunit 6/NADH:ubiquinone oxidoreductase subunit I